MREFFAFSRVFSSCVVPEKCWPVKIRFVLRRDHAGRAPEARPAAEKRIFGEFHPKSDSSAPGRRTFRAGSEGEREKWPQGGRIGSDGSVRETTSDSPVWPDQVWLLPLGSGDAHPRASDTWSLDNKCLVLPA